MVRISRCFEQKDRILVLPDTDLDKTAPPMPLHPGPLFILHIIIIISFFHDYLMDYHHLQFRFILAPCSSC